MIRDYIALQRGVPEQSFDVDITLEVGGGVDEAVRDARDAVRSAKAARRAAAQASRVAARLRSAGLTGRDIAAILGVSAQRVSQLLREAPSTGRDEALSPASPLAGRS